MGRKKKENDEPRVDKNIQNEILGSPKVIRLMKLWKVPAQTGVENGQVEFERKK